MLEIWVEILQEKGAQMKIESIVCDACLEVIDEKNERCRSKKGLAVYIKHGRKYNRIDICERCFRNLERLSNEQGKKLKEQNNG